MATLLESLWVLLTVGIMKCNWSLTQFPDDRTFQIIQLWISQLLFMLFDRRKYAGSFLSQVKITILSLRSILIFFFSLHLEHLMIYSFDVFQQEFSVRTPYSLCALHVQPVCSLLDIVTQTVMYVM